MNSFVKVARMLGGMILFLGLINVFEVGNAASAAKKMQNSPCEVPDGTNAAQAEKDAKQGGHMVSGEVLRVEGTDYVVKIRTGKKSASKSTRVQRRPRLIWEIAFRRQWTIRIGPYGFERIEGRIAVLSMRRQTAIRPKTCLLIH